jgi:hypothetical protein
MKIYEDKYMVIKDVSLASAMFLLKVLTASNKSGREAVESNSDAMNRLSECNLLRN